MNIYILSYRIAGNDGVSLECEHWENILLRMGHKVTFVGGELDFDGILIPELHFLHPEISRHHDSTAYGNATFKELEKDMNTQTRILENKLRELFSEEKVDLLITMNVFSIPMNLSLAPALAKVTSELNIPVIARHNDFWWERDRYLNEDFREYFATWFPPNLPNIRHVVINSEAGRQLKKRMGLDSFLIEDSFDYGDENLWKQDEYSLSFKEELGIDPEKKIFLQATRIIPRKRLELSITLFKRLSMDNIQLVFAGRSGDEGHDYEEQMKALALEYRIDAKFVGGRIENSRRESEAGKVFTLWDAYRNCDFILYPSLIEGFGNQFLEAVYFRKPVIITPYPVYMEDILPKGFETVNFSPEIKDETIGEIKFLLEPENSDKIKEMVDKNFEIARGNYSYQATTEKIQKVIDSFK